MYKQTTLFWVNFLHHGRCVVPARLLRREPQLACGAPRLRHGRAARVPFPRILQRELPMLLLIMVNQSMRIKMVLAVARTRCLCSAMCKTLSVMELSTSAVIMLLKIGVLIIVPCVLIKIFKLNHICLKLCWCLLSLASW